VTWVPCRARTPATSQGSPGVLNAGVRSLGYRAHTQFRPDDSARWLGIATVADDWCRTPLSAPGTSSYLWARAAT